MFHVCFRQRNALLYLHDSQWRSRRPDPDVVHSRRKCSRQLGLSQPDTIERHQAKLQIRPGNLRHGANDVQLQRCRTFSCATVLLNETGFHFKFQSVVRETEVKGTPKKQKRGLTPKKWLKGTPSRGMESPAGPSAVRSTNFVLVACLPITMKSINKTHFSLDRVSTSIDRHVRSYRLPLLSGKRFVGGGGEASESTTVANLATNGFLIFSLHSGAVHFPAARHHSPQAPLLTGEFRHRKRIFGWCLLWQLSTNIMCKLTPSETKVSTNGYIVWWSTLQTIFEDVSGFGAWHRRWCLLKNHTLSYWKYPDDEKFKVSQVVQLQVLSLSCHDMHFQQTFLTSFQEPTGSVDLKYCISEKIGLIPRDICARPNTFEILTVRRQQKGERDTLTSWVSNTVSTTRFVHTAADLSLSISLVNLRVFPFPSSLTKE